MEEMLITQAGVRAQSERARLPAETLQRSAGHQRKCFAASAYAQSLFIFALISQQLKKLVEAGASQQELA